MFVASAVNIRSVRYEPFFKHYLVCFFEFYYRQLFVALILQLQFGLGECKNLIHQSRLVLEGQ
jgi:hypothetical protein